VKGKLTPVGQFYAFDLEPQVIEVDCKKVKSTLRGIIPRGVRMPFAPKISLFVLKP